MNLERKADETAVLSFVVLFALSLVMYLQLRYGGMFSLVDVAVFTNAANSVVETGSLTKGTTYSNGFGYSAIVGMFSVFTDLSVSTLQLYVMPLGLVFTLVAGYLAIRAIFESRTALFGTLLLLMHPYFLFSTYRSTHEKFTYALIFLALFALARSFTAEDERVKVRYILFGYLAILGVSFLNTFFASAFIVAIATSLAGTTLLMLYFGRSIELRRMNYTVIISFVMLMITVLFFYPPARRFLFGLGPVLVQSLGLLLGNAPTATGGQTYQGVLTGWGSLRTYLVLTSFYWIVFPIAGLTWLSRGYAILRIDDIDDVPIGEVFVLVLFGAFSLQLLGAVVVDQLGAFFGTNAQLRMLPLVGFMAVTITANSVIRRYRSIRNSDHENTDLLDSNVSRFSSTFVRKTLYLVFTVVLAVGLVGFAATATLKASSEPALSENWIFTTHNEQEGMNWINTNTRDDYVWVGHNERIQAGHSIRHPSEPKRNTYEIASVGLAIHVVMQSETMHELSSTTGVPLPPVDDAHAIYSNGETRLYRYNEYRTLDDFNDALVR